jgi:hypothetical protein
VREREVPVEELHNLRCSPGVTGDGIKKGEIRQST